MLLISKEGGERVREGKGGGGGVERGGGVTISREY